MLCLIRRFCGSMSASNCSISAVNCVFHPGQRLDAGAVPSLDTMNGPSALTNLHTEAAIAPPHGSRNRAT
jgi:hypothetical protein